MRNIAFGYSNRCNISCDHCVAAGEKTTYSKMDLNAAKTAIIELKNAGITGISFTAGEPTIYFDDLLELLNLCKQLKIFTRVVTNCFWATDSDTAQKMVAQLKGSGLEQLRLSFSRWHQKSISKTNITNTVHGCQENDVDYFISFVTDFSAEDEPLEDYLRENRLKFFPEPLIYSGRARKYLKNPVSTDFRDNRCAMNCYLAPDFNLYACCDAGSHFTNTNAFFLGNLKTDEAEKLFASYDNNQLFQAVRFMGLSSIATFYGMRSSDIVKLRKCELCEILFNDKRSFSYLLENLSELLKYHK